MKNIKFRTRGSARRISPLLIIGILFLLTKVNYGQNKLDLSLAVDPFCIPFNGPLNQENGIGYYPVKVTGETNQSFSGYFSWYIFNDLGLKFGFGYHNFKYEVNYNILNPLDESESFMKNSRQFHTSDIGPIIGLVLNLNKFVLSTGLNMYIQHLEIYQSHNSSISDNFFFDPVNQTTAVLRIQENITFSFASSYNLFYVNVGYPIAKNVYLNFGYENSFSNGLPHLYEFKIIGNTINTTDEEHLLNDFAFLYKYSSINLGASYKFNLRKGI